MKLDIDKLEARLIERFGKDELERQINNFYERNSKAMSKEYARRTYILGTSKFLAEAKPSKVYPPENNNY